MVDASDGVEDIGAVSEGLGAGDFSAIPFSVAAAYFEVEPTVLVDPDVLGAVGPVVGAGGAGVAVAVSDKPGVSGPFDGGGGCFGVYDGLGGVGGGDCLEDKEDHKGYNECY